MHQHISPFHVAFAVNDLAKARAFYGGVLGCPEGRSTDVFIGFNLFGHQIVAHLCPRAEAAPKQHNVVDHLNVPIPHFGVILPLDQWEALVHRVRAAGVTFVIEPYVRFKGELGEQTVTCFLDFEGNALEFKSFADPSRIFAKD